MNKLKAYTFTKYESDKMEVPLERKVIISDKKRFDVMKMDNGNGKNMRTLNSKLKI